MYFQCKFVLILMCNKLYIFIGKASIPLDQVDFLNFLKYSDLGDRSFCLLHVQQHANRWNEHAYDYG